MKTEQFYGNFLKDGIGNTEDNGKRAIIDKVSKLLERAEGTSYEAEAETAKDMAVKLLAKHNMTLGDIQTDELLKIEEYTGKKHFQADRVLYQVIGNFTGVAFLYCAGDFPMRIYVGSRQNIEAFRYMLDIVLSQRERAWKRYEGKQWTTKQRFNMGFAGGVGEKCREIKRAADRVVSERGLVPVDEAEQVLAEYKRENKVKNGKKNTMEGDYDGYVAGKSVSLNRGIEEQEEIRRIA